MLLRDDVCWSKRLQIYEQVANAKPLHDKQTLLRCIQVTRCLKRCHSDISQRRTLGHSPPSGPSGAQQGQPGSPQAATRQTPSMHLRLSPLGHSPPSGPSGAQQGQSRSPQAAPGAGEAGVEVVGAGEPPALPVSTTGVSRVGEAGVGDDGEAPSVQMPLSHTRLSPCKTSCLFVLNPTTCMYHGIS